MARNRVIGNRKALLWKPSSDLVRFKEITLGKPVIMGRKTFQSIGHVLPGRTNIILAHDTAYTEQGCIIARSIEEALKAAEGSEEAMIIGGESVYRQFLPYASRIYLTVVEGDFEGDAHFPELDIAEWKETEKIAYPGDERNSHPHSFSILDKM